MKSRKNLSLDELIIAGSMVGVRFAPKVTGDSEITLFTSDGAEYVFDVQLEPETKLTPRED